MTAFRRRSGVVAVIAVAVMVGACSSSETPEDATAAAEGEEASGSPSDEASTRADFPDESTTGVPDGTDLEPSDSLTIDEDGTVVEGQEITGTVTVTADDVVIRDSRILGTGPFPIRVDGGKNLLVEDSEIDGQGQGEAAVAFGKYTLRRVHIHDVAEGPRVAGGDVTIEDSLIHKMVQKGDNHTDVVQVVSGSNIVVTGNTLDAHDPESGVMGNAAFMFGEDDGPVDDCRVEGNFLNGGNYTVNGGGSGTDGAACTFRDNVLGEDHRYGSVANIGPESDWDGSNVGVETGEPVDGD